MCALLVKCAALIVMIHGIRALFRWAGPGVCGLALGLPSTTAIVLVVFGWDHGATATATMAESSLLGLVAAVALPLAYMRAVSRGARLPTAIAAAVAGYLSVAWVLGCLPVLGVGSRLFIAVIGIVSASELASRLPLPLPDRSLAVRAPSPGRRAFLRTVIPLLYVLAVTLVDHIAGPRWTGLVGTFPSMSLVVLAVTHLEAGPLEASRIARVLPAGNLSTLTFLACVRAVCPTAGLLGGMVAGYVSAIAMLSLVAAPARWIPDWRLGWGWERNTVARRRAGGLPPGFAAHQGLGTIRIHAPARLAPHRTGRTRLHRVERMGFSPHVERLAW
jgi:hypothetical protein